MSTPTLLLDCDGVLADTERDGHLVAFNHMFEELGVPIQWDDSTYADLLRVGGGKERLMSFLTAERAAALGMSDDADSRLDVVGQWHVVKSRIFRELVADGALAARPGVARLIHEGLEAGWCLAVASTSAVASVESVLTSVVGGDAARCVKVFAGDVVERKKPAPDIYLHALRGLGSDPANTVVVEDSGVGCRAAVSAGLPVVVTLSGYTAGEDFTGAAVVLTDLGEPSAPARVVDDPARLAPNGDAVVDLAFLRRVIDAHAPA
ncbi:HAD-IA family hydrolase [Tessaracoccus antarcticus]|uniref:HAD family hydrolase n=1 Tax=Tessaracoccus antarcticus TaxID=2479848 RepID=A0A3M0GIW0_9ACTN|nr:HAD-IA family hydrolase [Tessaracoccus antarcticus]RMB61553.1 HAD family hydrolase [Tessaracoccus antarcticus]